MNREQAERAAREYLDQIEEENPDVGEQLIESANTWEHHKAWVVQFNSKDYLVHDIGDRMMIPDIIIIPKNEKAVHLAPTDRDFTEYLDAL